jgi:hypothetical protein
VNLTPYGGCWARGSSPSDAYRNALKAGKATEDRVATRECWLCDSDAYVDGFGTVRGIVGFVEALANLPEDSLALVTPKGSADDGVDTGSYVVGIYPPEGDDERHNFESLDEAMAFVAEKMRA